MLPPGRIRECGLGGCFAFLVAFALTLVLVTGGLLVAALLAL